MPTPTRPNRGTQWRTPVVLASVEISYYIQAGDQTVAIGKTSGSAKLNRKKFSCNLVHILTVKEEKIVRLEVDIDTDAMNAALVSA